MKSFFALASLAATVANATILGWDSNNHAPIPAEPIQDETIAPVVVLHGLNGNCNQIH